MLKDLQLTDVFSVIEAAERANAASPPSELGMRLSEGLALFTGPTPEDAALEQSIRALSHKARMELMALIWIGRGDDREAIARDPNGTYLACLAHARRNSDAGDVHYVAERSLSLPTYLREGLKTLGETVG